MTCGYYPFDGSADFEVLYRYSILFNYSLLGYIFLSKPPIFYPIIKSRFNYLISLYLLIIIHFLSSYFLFFLFSLYLLPFSSLKRGRFAIPNFLTDECASMIKTIIQSNPADRPSLAALKSHYWFVGKPSSQPPLPNGNSNNPNNISNNQHLNQLIRNNSNSRGLTNIPEGIDAISN